MGVEARVGWRGARRTVGCNCKLQPHVKYRGHDGAVVASGGVRSGAVPPATSPRGSPRRASRPL